MLSRDEGGFVLEYLAGFGVGDGKVARLHLHQNHISLISQASFSFVPQNSFFLRPGLRRPPSPGNYRLHEHHGVRNEPSKLLKTMDHTSEGVSTIERTQLHFQTPGDVAFRKQQHIDST